MSEEQKTDSLQEESRAKAGLEILFARREPGDGLDGLRKYDVVKELRERFWIREAGDAGWRQRLWSVRAVWRIGRQDLGRDRNQSGDGFRYVYSVGSESMQSRAEWFEVTEVFEGVEAKDNEAFMLVNHGETVGWNFDTDQFLRGLDMGIPCRAAQRRAADSVLNAVEKKLTKGSYESMWRGHGYGTLVVGLPLWFATIPADPRRVSNVIDDFMTRVLIGLQSYARQLKRKSCPFWRVVVVWMVSAESLRHLHCKTRNDVYGDPSFRTISGLPVTRESLLTIASELEKGARLPLPIAVSNPQKHGEEMSLQLPPRVDAVKRALERANRGPRVGRLLERAKARAMARAIEVFGFLRWHGLSGLGRWATTRLSPRHLITRWVMRRQALHLYRASRRRQATKDKRRRDRMSTSR